MALSCFEANIRVKGRGCRTTVLYVDLCWEINPLLIQIYSSADIFLLLALVMLVFWYLCFYVSNAWRAGWIRLASKHGRTLSMDDVDRFDGDVCLGQESVGSAIDRRCVCFWESIAGLHWSVPMVMGWLAVLATGLDPLSIPIRPSF